MTISEMLSQSGLLTLLGMAVVFSFLIIMILAMCLLHKVIHAMHLDEAKKTETPKTVSSAPVASPAVDNGAIVAAIAAAVKERQSL